MVTTVSNLFHNTVAYTFVDESTWETIDALLRYIIVDIYIYIYIYIYTTLNRDWKRITRANMFLCKNMSL